MASLPDLATCKKVGFIVPSSNAAVEPITQAIFQSMNRNVICIFTRIQVKTLGSDEKSTSQFSTETLVAAARLLADAEPDCIIWNGTSGMWTGADLEADKKLAQAMQSATDIPCSTTTLATIRALEFLSAPTISLAVPYTEALTAKLVSFFNDIGYEVTRAERLPKTPASNIDIGKSALEDIRDVILRCGSSECDAIVVACTNWPAAGLVEKLEEELDMPVVDSIIVTAWWALRMIGITAGVSGWGRLLK